MKFNEINFISASIESKSKLSYKYITVVAIILCIIAISSYLIIVMSIKAKDEQDFIQEETILKQDISKNITEPRIPIISDKAKNEIKHIYNSDTKRVFLTFDDGPSNNVTPIILDILKENNIHATFFVLGSRAELYPELIKRQYEEGHYIANHGYSHDYKSIYANASKVLEEYKKTEECIKNALNNKEYNSYLFRFPGGSSGGKYSKIKSQAIDILKENNIEYIDWNCLTKDAEGSFEKEQLLQNLYETLQGKNSIVVLMHDTGTKTSTAEALPDVIKYFQDNGYIFENFYNIMK